MARTPTLGKITVGEHTYYASKIRGKRYHFGNVADTPRKDAERDFAAKLKELTESNAPVSTAGRGVTVLELFDRYLNWMKTQRADKSFTNRTRNLQSLANWIVPADLAGAGRKCGELRADKFTRAHLERWQHYLTHDAPVKGRTRKGYALKSVIHFLTDVKTAYGWAAGNRSHSGGVLPADCRPLASYPIPALPPKDLTEAGLPTADDFRAYHAEALKTGRVYADLLTVYYSTGARTDELTAAKIRHYAPRSRAITLGTEKRTAAMGNNATVRKIHLTDDAAEAIERQIAARKREGRGEPDAPIFVTRTGKQISVVTLCHYFDRWYKRIRKTNKAVRKITAYGFRHLWISEALMVGVELPKAAKMAGTSAREIQRTYGHFFDDDLREAANRVDAARRNR